MSKVLFEIELDKQTLEQIDAWWAEQPGQPTQAEAVQRLVEVGLAVVGKNEVRISDGEKLIMMMLRDLYKHQNVDGDIDTDFIQDALIGGHYWGLQWQYGGLLHDHADDPAIVSETIEILEMWYFIEGGYKELSEKDRDRIKKEAHLASDISFHGFDGNNETKHFIVAKFLVNKLERFDIFNDRRRDLNSHSPSIEIYRRMLSVYRDMRGAISFVNPTAEQIIHLMNARLHPENSS